jgi:hypothetical protein
MRNEGLKRAIQFLNQQELKSGMLVTDRHRQIAMWILENLPSKSHHYDVWHIPKML